MPETNADAPPPPETTPFAVPSDYTAAIDKVLSLATREVLVFDRDLADGGWNTPARADSLRRFLLGHRMSRLEFVVHDTLHIERFLPRLTLLLRDLSHKMAILRTTGDGRNAWDDFVLVDNVHFVHRFHLDSLRGESSLHNPRKGRQLRERYDEIVGFTEAGVNATQLGL